MGCGDRREWGGVGGWRWEKLGGCEKGGRRRVQRAWAGWLYRRGTGAAAASRSHTQKAAALNRVGRGHGSKKRLSCRPHNLRAKSKGLESSTSNCALTWQARPPPSCDCWLCGGPCANFILNASTLLLQHPTAASCVRPARDHCSASKSYMKVPDTTHDWFCCYITVSSLEKWWTVTCTTRPISDLRLHPNPTTRTQCDVVAWPNDFCTQLLFTVLLGPQPHNGGRQYLRNSAFKQMLLNSTSHESKVR